MDDDEFQRRKEVLRSDRDADLEDNESLKRSGVIDAAAKTVRDAATMRRYDRSLEQLISQRDSGEGSAAFSSSSCSSSSSSSNEDFVNVRVKEGPTEIVPRRSVGIDAASTTFSRAVELAVGNNDEWLRLMHLPLEVTAFRSAEEKARESISVGNGSPVMAAIKIGYHFLLATFTAPSPQPPQPTANNAFDRIMASSR